MIEAKGLRKQYGDFVAVRDLDLQVMRGEVFALLGPNGAGKTTTVEILEGYRRRTAGEATVLGTDPAHGNAHWRARIGIVPQTTGNFEELTVEEVVRHFAGFYPNPLNPDEVIELVGLGGKRKVRGMKLSGGQKRRLDVALGLVGDPELIFLDEPTTGLDPVARRQAWGLVENLTELGKTVLLTTHYLDEAEAIAHRCGIIIAGELAEVGTPRDLGGRSETEAHVSFKLTPALSGRPLPPLPATAVDTVEGTVLVRTDAPTAAVTMLGRWAAEAGVAEVPGLTVTRATLEDVYLRMVAAHDSAAASAMAEGKDE